MSGTYALTEALALSSDEIVIVLSDFYIVQVLVGSEYLSPMFTGAASVVRVSGYQIAWEEGKKALCAPMSTSIPVLSNISKNDWSGLVKPLVRSWGPIMT